VSLTGKGRLVYKELAPFVVLKAFWSPAGVIVHGLFTMLLVGQRFEIIPVISSSAAGLREHCLPISPSQPPLPTVLTFAPHLRTISPLDPSPN